VKAVAVPVAVNYIMAIEMATVTIAGAVVIVIAVTAVSTVNAVFIAVTAVSNAVTAVSIAVTAVSIAVTAVTISSHSQRSRHCNNLWKWVEQSFIILECSVLE
jgi:hypothetical protein